MDKFSMFTFTISIWYVTMGMQVTSAVLAVRILKGAGRYWLPWAAFCFGVVLMIPMSWRPLELAQHTGIYDSTLAMLTFIVSLCFLCGLLCLEKILHAKTTAPAAE